MDQEAVKGEILFALYITHVAQPDNLSKVGRLFYLWGLKQQPIHVF